MKHLARTLYHCRANGRHVTLKAMHADSARRQAVARLRVPGRMIEVKAVGRVLNKARDK